MSAHSAGKLIKRAKKWVDPLRVRGAITEIKECARLSEPDDRPKVKGRRFAYGKGGE